MLSQVLIQKSAQDLAVSASASSAGASEVSSGASAPASTAATIALTVLAGNPLFAKAATALAASNFPASTETVAVRASASISTFATPGSDCNDPLTVARQPPQVMPGQKNSTVVADASGSSMATSLEAGSVVMSVVLSGTASGALPCVQPIAAARRSMGKYFSIFIVLFETNVCLSDHEPRREPMSRVKSVANYSNLILSNTCKITLFAVLIGHQRQ
jgi:hypothetical protein